MNESCGGDSAAKGERPLTVLGIYPWDRFWSMGEFRGAASFFLAPQSLVKAGHDVHVSMPRGGARWGDSGAGAAAIREKTGGSGLSEDYHGIKLHRYRFAIDFMPMSGRPLYIHLTRPFRYLYYIALAFIAGLRAARGVKPDVVVGYGAWGAPVAFLVARFLGVPNVTRLFGQSLPPGDGMRFKDRVRCLLNYPEIIAFRTPCSRLVVHDDGSGGDKVARRLGVPDSRLRFWRNGVNKELFRPPDSRGDAKRDLGLGPDVPVLLSVSRLDKEKHHERLISAIPGILKRFPKTRVFIIGEGPERSFLEKEADRLGVAGAVKLPGAISQGELAKYYRACDILLSLSDRTNVGNPTFEAMSCGACIVALDAGDTASVVRSGETGILVSYEALGDLAGVLLGLMEDEPRRIGLGKGAADYADRILPSVEERGRMEAQAVVEAVAD